MSRAKFKVFLTFPKTFTKVLRRSATHIPTLLYLDINIRLTSDDSDMY